MSHTHELVCPGLKLRLWIGQGRRQEITNLYSTVEAVDKLQRFLNHTRGRELVLMESQEINDVYSEFEPEPDVGIDPNNSPS